MIEINSRDDLERWMENAPHIWVQAITMRSALRALPNILSDLLTDEWLTRNAVNFFRAIFISWASRSLPTYDMKRAASAAGMPSHESPTYVDQLMAGADYTVGVALQASFSEKYSRIFADINDWEKHPSIQLYMSKAIEVDCNWPMLQNETPENTAGRFVSEPIWLNQSPIDWSLRLNSTTTRLLTLDPSYQVWIDWYNRRIEGHDAAFDIPGDIDRTHDKAILARLADATDEDFWGKGATYVNTTLQRWIDEARIEARIEEILGKLRGGATAHYGAPEEMAGRAALLDELDRLLGKSWQARHGIGGNHPPEPIDAPLQPVALPQEMREPLDAISTELEKREPDAVVVVEQVKLLRRVGRKLEKMAGVAGDEFAKTVGGELGKWAVKASFWLILINQILDWLAPLIR